MTETETRTWLIYLLCNNGIPFYVGSTLNYMQRMRAHRHRFGHEFITIILETGNGNRNAAESFWIEFYRSQGDFLKNKTSGGNGPGTGHSDETRKLIGTKVKGQIVSEETKKKISIANSGRKRPDNAERNHKYKGCVRGPLNISDEERERRRVTGKVAGLQNFRKRWENITADDLAELSTSASVQMVQVWKYRSDEEKNNIMTQLRDGLDRYMAITTKEERSEAARLRASKVLRETLVENGRKGGKARWNNKKN